MVTKMRSIATLRDPIAFGDLRAGEEAERNKLEGRRRQLSDLVTSNKRSLTPAEEAELQEIEQKLATDDVVDPLFKVIQSVLASGVGDHKQGLLPSQQIGRIWQEIVNAVQAGKTLRVQVWSAVVDFAGLQPFDTQQHLAKSLTTLISNVAQTTQLLDRLTEAFDKYVRSPIKPQQKPEDRLEALAAEIEKVPNGGAFGNQLALALRQGYLEQAENLVDWLLAAFRGVSLARSRNYTGELTKDEQLVAAVYGILWTSGSAPSRKWIRRKHGATSSSAGRYLRRRANTRRTRRCSARSCRSS